MNTLVENALRKVYQDLQSLRYLAIIRLEFTSLLLSLLLLSIQKKICKQFSEKSLKPKLPPLTCPIKCHWRPNHLTSIVVSLTWNVIISASNIKIILPPPELEAYIIFFLQYFSCITISSSVGNSTSKSMRLKTQSLLPRKSLRSYFIET